MGYNSHTALEQNRALQKRHKSCCAFVGSRVEHRSVPSVAHEMSQEADLLAIASAGALSSSSAGVQFHY